MSAAGISRRDPQRDFSFAYSALGDELPSLSCDLGEVNSTEFEQLLLQGLSDPFLLDMHQMQPMGSSQAPGGITQLGDVDHGTSAACDLTSLFLEDVPRPRDINLSFPGEAIPSALIRVQPEFVSEDTKPDASVLIKDESPESYNQMFYQQIPSSYASYPQSSPAFTPSPSSHTPVSASTPSSSIFDALIVSGRATPSNSGGVTPQDGSRASSPTWSESSGTMSCGSTSERLRSRHHSRSSVCSTSSYSSIAGDPKSSSKSVVTVPRHKRPSHKRAEIKRRDKIKTCLEDMKEAVPTIRDKGKLSESAILIKAAEYIHHLKDEQTERGKKSAELQREIECLSKEIHSFQENLPAAGLKEETASHLSLDDQYQAWLSEHSQKSTKFSVFSAITSKMWDSFKEIVGSAETVSALSAKVQEWQNSSLALPVLRKQILSGLLSLSRQDSIVMTSEPMKKELGSPVDRSTLSETKS